MTEHLLGVPKDLDVQDIGNVYCMSILHMNVDTSTDLLVFHLVQHYI